MASQKSIANGETSTNQISFVSQKLISKLQEASSVRSTPVGESLSDYIACLVEQNDFLTAENNFLKEKIKTIQEAVLGDQLLF